MVACPAMNACPPSNDSLLPDVQAAIEYLTKNYDNAKEALTDMPPRAEEELDPVSTRDQEKAEQGG
eukprot:1160777-Pelagomonas_calceolata.AAC.12